MVLRLLGLRWEGEGCVSADLDSGIPRGHVRTNFEVGRSGDHITVWPDPDVLNEFATSIEEVRRIVSAVKAFFLAAEANGYGQEGPSPNG
jgi:hypothetical protein